VLLLQVPSSAAGYTHLAGRTGRNGLKGTAISLCRPKEAPKLLAIAETLGLSMFDLLAAEEKRPNENENDKAVPPSASNDTDDDGGTQENRFPWAKLSKSSLQRKSAADITKYLTIHGVALSGENGAKVKKFDLLEAVDDLHRSDP
jgi:superfamily II DNA/RNA helicase